MISDASLDRFWIGGILGLMIIEVPALYGVLFVVSICTLGLIGIWMILKGVGM